MFSAFRLTTSSSFVPIPLCLSVCLSVRRRGERHSDMMVDTIANKDTEQHAITCVLTPQGPELSKVSDLHLWEITLRNKKGGRREKVDIDQMRVQTNSAGITLSIQWRTMSPRQRWHPLIHFGECFPSFLVLLVWWNDTLWNIKQYAIRTVSLRLYSDNDRLQFGKMSDIWRTMDLWKPNK